MRFDIRKRRNVIPALGALIPVPTLALALAVAATGCLSPNRDKLNADAAAAAGASFYVDSVKAGQSVADQNDSFGFPSRKKILFTACLKDAGAMQPILNNQPFGVSDGLTTRSVVTDYRGCVMWTEYHQFNYLASETYTPFTRTFIAQGAHTGSVALSLAINPWNDDASAIADLRVDNVPKLAAATGQALGFNDRVPMGDAPAASLDLKTLTLQFLGLDYARYKVNTLLSLSIAHSYRMQLGPTFFRHAIDGTWKNIVPYSGKVRVTLVLVPTSVTGTPSASQVIAVSQKEMSFVRDQLIDDVSIEFPDISLVSSRVRALFELDLIQDGQSYGNGKFEGVIGPLPTWALMPNLVLSQESASQLYAEYQKQQAAISGTDKNGFQILSAYGGFKRVAAADLAGDGVAASEAQGFLDGKLTPADTDAFLRKLCPRLYPMPAGTAPGAGLSWWQRIVSAVPFVTPRRAPNETELQFCARSPSHALEVSRRDVVEKLNSDTPKLNSISQTDVLTISATFSKNATVIDSTGNDNRINARYRVGMDLSAKGGAAIPSTLSPVSGGLTAGIDATVGFGTDYFHSILTTHDTTTINTVSNVRSMVLTAVSNSFDLDVVSRRCAIVGLSPDALPTDAVRKDDSLPAGLMLCADQAASRNATETYYLVSQTGGATGNPFSDAYDAHEMPFRMFIRGTGAYTALKSALSTPNLEIILKQDPEVTQDFASSLINPHMIQEAPGVLSAGASAN